MVVTSGIVACPSLVPGHVAWGSFHFDWLKLWGGGRRQRASARPCASARALGLPKPQVCASPRPVSGTKTLAALLPRSHSRSHPHPRLSRPRLSLPLPEPPQPPPLPLPHLPLPGLPPGLSPGPPPASSLAERPLLPELPVRPSPLSPRGPPRAYVALPPLPGEASELPLPPPPILSDLPRLPRGPLAAPSHLPLPPLPLGSEGPQLAVRLSRPGPRVEPPAQLLPPLPTRPTFLRLLAPPPATCPALPRLPQEPFPVVAHPVEHRPLPAFPSAPIPALPPPHFFLTPPGSWTERVALQKNTP
ncbi:uncharacterized protein LOC127545667 [Antechinus flavipes]|uniref:uncharacterized protein LOC127545667 n=1 Tax=Antechinus flavipes TaxID=38775 RepID=UPI002235C631|nr:uncharacterized protein LOC127545667 [Antechinus flavipes]